MLVTSSMITQIFTETLRCTVQQLEITQNTHGKNTEQTEQAKCKIKIIFIFKLFPTLSLCEVKNTLYNFYVYKY